MSTDNPEEVQPEEETAPAEETAPEAATESDVAQPEPVASDEPTESDVTEAEPIAESDASETELAEPEATVSVEAPDLADDGNALGLTLGSGAPAEEGEVRPAPVIRGKTDRFGVALGTGRRKTSVARVRIKPGDGKLTINGRDLDEYVCVERDRKMIQAPIEAVEQNGKVDVWVRVNGGGTTGQTGAIVLGIARALTALDPAFHHTLADGGYLTRDGRMVERKKYGLRKARRSFQFSKR